MGATGKVLDIEGDGEFAGRVAFDHLAGDMPRAVRGTHDMGAADPQLDLDRIAEKILPAEIRHRQRPPDFFRRRRNVDGVDGGRLEVICRVHVLSFRC
jgi:hypothetical protein